MANAVYPTAKKAFMDGDVDLLADNIKVVLVDLADYTYNAAHQFLSDVPAGARVATSGNLAGKTTTVVSGASVFDATDPTISAVTGDPVEAYIVYKDTGSAATSQLLSFHDTEPDGTTPIALTPNGGDVAVVFDPGTNKIFRFA